MALSDLSEFITANYEVLEWRHAVAVLKFDFPNEYRDIIEVMSGFSFKSSDILKEGGGKTEIADSIDQQFRQRNWTEKKFTTRIMVDGDVLESPTHKIDEYKNKVAVEVEWNNKDPFFDRDLNNFRLLFELRAISVGVIITRTDELQGIFDELKVGEKYGWTTTCLGKLMPRLEGGSGGGCPVLVFGIKPSLYQVDMTPQEVDAYVRQRAEARRLKKEKQALEMEARRLRVAEKRQRAAERKAEQQRRKEERQKKAEEKNAARNTQGAESLFNDPG